MTTMKLTFFLLAIALATPSLADDLPNLSPEHREQMEKLEQQTERLVDLLGRLGRKYPAHSTEIQGISQSVSFITQEWRAVYKKMDSFALKCGGITSMSGCDKDKRAIESRSEALTERFSEVREDFGSLLTALSK